MPLPPILAFHATNVPEDFARFEHTEDLGFHFGNAETANKRLEHICQLEPEEIDGARILPCLLSLRNPVRLPDCHTWGLNSVIPALEQAGVISPSQGDELSADGYLDREGFRQLLNSAGYDGVVYSNETEGGGDSYLVVDADCIQFALATKQGTR